MTTPGLKEKLIDKIRKTEDEALLEEISVLIQLQEADVIYKLNSKQKEIVLEAKEQIKNNESLTNEQADEDIEEWLKK
ncbi:MAG: hypothetical protein M3413_04710 [Bacteroidota bacterium]|jgi:hypothetical protein|nr:hypothetical protein [Flavisolibacter sp.]MDQ3550809.1 hypothetical protein [Bacteroidota bacterium]